MVLGDLKIYAQLLVFSFSTDLALSLILAKEPTARGFVPKELYFLDEVESISAEHPADGREVEKAVSTRYSLHTRRSLTSVAIA